MMSVTRKAEGISSDLLFGDIELGTLCRHGCMLKRIERSRRLEVSCKTAAEVCLAPGCRSFTAPWSSPEGEPAAGEQDGAPVVRQRRNLQRRRRLGQGAEGGCQQRREGRHRQRARMWQRAVPKHRHVSVRTGKRRQCCLVRLSRFMSV